MAVSHYFHYMAADLEVESTPSFTLTYADKTSVLITLSHPVFYNYQDGDLMIYGTINQDLGSFFREGRAWTDTVKDLFITRLKEMMIVWGISSYKAD